MHKKLDFANIQVFCNNKRIVAKYVYERLLKGHITSESDTLCSEFFTFLNIFGIREDLTENTKQSLNKVFNMVSSSPYFLRGYEDGWTTILHEDFSIDNISTFAMQYSKGAPEHLVVAIGYNNEHSLCTAILNGNVIFKCEKFCDSNNENTYSDEIELFANEINSTHEIISQLVISSYKEQIAAMSNLFEHDITFGFNDIGHNESALYLEVSANGIE